MHILSNANAMKKMSFNQTRDFIFESCYKKFEFFKENSYFQWNVWKKKKKKKGLLLLATKLTVKLPDPRNAKEHYQSFIRKKNTKSVKQSKIITQHPKTFENPNIVDIKSVIIAHAKTLHKLPKTIRQKKVSLVGSNSPLYSDTKKLKFFWPKKRRNNKTRICF